MSYFTIRVAQLVFHFSHDIRILSYGFHNKCFVIAAYYTHNPVLLLVCRKTSLPTGALALTNERPGDWEPRAHRWLGSWMGGGCMQRVLKTTLRLSG